MINDEIKNKLNPEQGNSLVSEPFMHDPYFKRSVVLLAHYNNLEGAFGFILNKKLDIKIGDIIPEFKNINIPVYFGGPVATGNLYYIHKFGNLLEGSIPICKDIYWGGNYDTLKELILEEEIHSNQIKFFVGYSGWAKNQLEREIKRKTWVVVKIPCNDLLKNSENLWGMTLKNIGSKYAGLARFPEEPSLN